MDGDGRGIDRLPAVASMKSRKMRRDFAFVYSFPSGPKEPVEATRHERELEVTVNFHRDR